MTDGALYARGSATLLASWEAYARGSAGAAVERLPGVAVARFPTEPESGVYNNALLEVGAGPEAVDAMEAAYRAARIDRYAAWVHESDRRMQDRLARRGYVVDTLTRAMGMALDHLAVVRPVPVCAASWPEYLGVLRREGLPRGLLAGVDGTAFRVAVAPADATPQASGIAFDHDGDCGIFNVGTLEPARRRGLGTAITAWLLHDARDRGSRTATLQATAMAERLYAALGFRDLGRFVELTPRV